jgi:multisubunit Na+/H+ antiporter MnhC subunit
VVFRDVPWLDGDGTRRIAGLAVLALGAATWLLGAGQARRRRAPGLARAVARPLDLLPVAIGVIAVGVAAFVVALVLPART